MAESDLNRKRNMNLNLVMLTRLFILPSMLRWTPSCTP